ncbi:MAG TPA: FHA domain-containing protein [Candidatus Limnocylindria bacterium]|nr:FHA domain-containing protein [Candidatus Limnocylindria bacterium]
MARLLVKNPDLAPGEILLTPGCNRLGREGENDFLVPHPSVSRQHCEVWLTDEAVLVRDLSSRNGTFIEDARVDEAQIFTGQTLRVGDVEMILAEAPVKISVPELAVAPLPRELTFMPDGTPCCFRHDGLAAQLRCAGCEHFFCTSCVRALRVAGGAPRRFCPECGNACEPIIAAPTESKRNWLGKLMDAFTKPPSPPRRG